MDGDLRRTLSAVLAADVVGYSRMMRDDAEATLASLSRLRREIVGPAIAARHGRIVKTMGDGWIAVFGAVVDAVTCAMTIQDRIEIEGALKLRLGVHLGDVAVADQDVFGDGVNVAARLQDLAAPGALAISSQARDLLDGAARCAFDDAGARALKNIDDPVRVWVRGGEIAGCAADLSTDGFPELIIEPVAAQGGPEAEALAAALTGDLAVYIDATRWLDARVGAPHQGAYRLAASVRIAGARARLEATLTGPNGTRVAAEKFDGDAADPFAFQDAAATWLSAQCLRWVIKRENQKIDALPDDALSAEQWSLRALSTDGLSDETYAKVLDCISQAIELRPDWGYIHASGLAVLTAGLIGGHMAVAPYMNCLSEWAAKADELEPAHSPARIMLAMGDHQGGGDPAKAGAAARRILRGLPFDPEALFWAGILFVRIGEVREGLDCLEAMDRGPQVDILRRGALFWRGLAHLMLGEFEEALRFADLVEEPGVHFAPLFRLRASALGHLGRGEAAAAQLRALSAKTPGQTVKRVRRSLGFRETVETERYLEGLRLAGMPEE